MDVDPAWLETDYYRMLGVAPEATSDDIVRAYRRAARDLHPDTSRDPDAVERFRALSTAYDVLRDPAKRKAYDRARRSRSAPRRGGGYSIRVENLDHLADAGTGVRSATRTGVFGDVPSSLGSRRRTTSARRRDLEVELWVPLEAAVFGTTTPVNVPDHGSVTARVPPGADDGSVVRIPGRGAADLGGRRGDVVVTVRVEPHPLFGRVGDDVTITVPVSYSEAVLGTEVSVPTLDGDVVRLRVPPGTPAGRTFRVRGRGVPGSPPGDQLVTVHLDVPRQLSPRQRELVEELRHHDRTDLRTHLEHST